MKRIESKVNFHEITSNLDSNYSIKKITSQLTSIYWNLHLLKCTAATHSFLHQIIIKFDEIFWLQISAGQLHCKDCGGFFAGQRGLQDHQRQKHNKAGGARGLRNPSIESKLKLQIERIDSKNHRIKAYPASKPYPKHLISNMNNMNIQYHWHFNTVYENRYDVFVGRFFVNVCEVRREWKLLWCGSPADLVLKGNARS